MEPQIGDKRFAPPTARVDDVQDAGQALGGRGARFGAVMIDGLIQAALIWGAIFMLFPTLKPNAGSQGFAGVLVLQLLIGIGVFFVLQGYLLATQGQTIGKKLVGLRIVRSNGERAGFGRLIGLRYGVGFVIVMVPLIGAIYSLVDSLMIFRESRRCLHDLIADTVVVRA